jgi:muramoyltetrapeptide carboxypeptidase
MNRKEFVAALTTLFVTPAVMAQDMHLEDCIKMPVLKAGDLIGITCPAGFITAEDIAPGVAILAQWGFKVLVGNTVGKKDNTFGGTDKERAEDLQQMLDNKKVKAIMCARGGYGCMRIIDDLKWQQFLVNPKWLIGFSDITALHCHLFTLNVPSIHSKMLNSFPKDGMIDDTQKSILTILTGKKVTYTIVPNANNVNGTAAGKLIGGNLSIVYNMVGTKSDIDTKGTILFLEDVGEQLYSVDRMLWNLRRSGKLKHLAGLIIGGFNKLKDDEKDPFVRTLSDMVKEVTKGYKYPVCYDFPCGHQKNNYALACGKMHTLKVTETEVRFVEK